MNKPREKLDDKDIPYFRDFPFETLEEAFYFGSMYGIVENSCDYIGALLLMWLKEGKINIIKVEDKVIIDMTKFTWLNEKYDREIYLSLYFAAGDNHLLEVDEFKEIFRHESDLKKKFQKIFNSVEEKYVKAGLIQIGADMRKRVFISDEIKEKVRQLAGLKKFLLDFSILDEKEVIEVHLWENYLVYAQLFGIADKVDNSFYKLYPNYDDMITHSIFVKSLLMTFPLGILVIDP